jgi:putative transposase
MPRTGRTFEAGDLLHLTLRGVNKTPIFQSDGDRRRFLLLVLDEFRASSSKLLSYCLMDNHVHMLVRAGSELSARMHRLLTRYAQHFNEGAGRVGHLLQDRFHDTKIRSTAHALNAIAYIHLNPVKDGLVNSVEDWPWSSHFEFLSGNGPFLSLEVLEDALGMSIGEIREQYQHRVEEFATRRRGGWRGESLSDLLGGAAADEGLEESHLREKSHDKVSVIAKSGFVKRARAAGHSLDAIAEFLGCSRPAVWKLLTKGTVPLVNATR